MTVNVYIASSIRAPSRLHDGVVGFVLQAGNTDLTRTVFGTVKEVTKNHADIICLKNALSHILPHKNLILIHTNSIYVKQSLISMRENQRFSNIKYSDEWQVIFNHLKDKEFEVKHNEPNEFKSWLQSECDRRAAAHGYK